MMMIVVVVLPTMLENNKWVRTLVSNMMVTVVILIETV